MYNVSRETLLKQWEESLEALKQALREGNICLARRLFKSMKIKGIAADVALTGFSWESFVRVYLNRK